MLDRFSTSFHGTILEYAENIVGGLDVKAGRFFTDFGKGFYVTSNVNQAKEWAIQKHNLLSQTLENVKPAIVKIQIDTISLGQLSGLLFNDNDDKWAEFVYNCRKEGKNNNLFHEYDFVYGPLADGKFTPLFNKYHAGKIPFEEFHRGIRPYTRYLDQLSLHTLEAAMCIHHLEVETIETIDIR